MKSSPQPFQTVKYSNCLVFFYRFQCQPYMANTGGQTPKKIIQLTQNFALFCSRIGFFPIITQRAYTDDSLIWGPESFAEI